MIEDSVIIGAGPAGLSAALQLMRHGISPLVLEAESPGGLLRNAGIVENYPGFPESIPGPTLADRFVRQALAAGLSIVKKKVDVLRRENKLFQITTEGNVLFSRTVIIASGTKPKQLTGIEVNDAAKKKIFYEIKSLLHNEGRHFVIVGAGDAAFDYALNLSRKNMVTILNRSSVVKSLPLLQKRAVAAGITYYPNTSIREISGAADGQVRIKCADLGKPIALKAHYVVGAIGRDPQTDFIPHSVLDRLGDLQKRGLLRMAGDVKNGMFRQTAIAVGDGILAGMLTYRTLQAVREKHEDHC
ncbi:MAG: FAD-dependent pyridine nucleotide-disulfide oxidoreductase [Deltaproteobacteria bacterium]|nr:FAD-dependent pyridine nucleotide-disulfide oxidoreductase [Deltaproteobacteria bacterium]